MTFVDEIRRLVEYNQWANLRVLATVSDLDADEIAGPVGGEIHDLLRHIVWVQEEWRRVFAPDEPGDEIDLAGLDEIADAFEKSHRAMLRLLDARPAVGWDDRPLDALPASAGTIVIQVLMHGVQHRAEVGVMLNTLGRSFGDVDFLAFALERES